MNRTGASATAELVPHCLALPTTWSFSTRTRFPCMRSWPFLAFGTIYGQILEFPIRRGPLRALGALGSIFALAREAALNPGALSSLPRSANRHLSFFFGFSWCWFFFSLFCAQLPTVAINYPWAGRLHSAQVVLVTCAPAEDGPGEDEDGHVLHSVKCYRWAVGFWISEDRLRLPRNLICHTAWVGLGCILEDSIPHR